ncbi:MULTISPECIES: ABC transporter substrate-binding protein [Pseudonocardia]|uniref:Iron-utilization periplasmic protein n=2 Tax=Pseudonocardia TaxID=1847 RepID=A0A1Y2MKN8_PSEAH|nr:MULTISPECIES: ABC transporter substrate-binding protein [Pseudonocardia]OSY35824.1 Iron-utilization periplasmic protein precursor [Pseudonocardia autotrophica]TDN73118.1 iron(III) transport system substrate-binding protein [Pseudonocardia autotrophica]
MGLSGTARRRRGRSARTGLAALLAVVVLGGCAAEASGTDDLLPVPARDTSDGLVIAGETIADRELYEAARDSSVSIFSGMGFETEDLTVRRFREETGIDAEFIRMPSNKLLERVLSEAGADRLSVDIVRTTDTKATDTLAEAGVLVPYRTPFDEELRANGVVFDDGRYISSFYSLYAFAYNTRVVPPEEAPTEWADLLQPRYRNAIGTVQIGAGSYNMALSDLLVQTFGEDYLRRLGEQGPIVYDSVAVEMEALSRGEIAAATVGLNNGIALPRSGAPIKMVIPDSGASAAYTPLALTTRGADNPAAQVFMNWQMSRSGQEFAAAQGFVPARTSLGAQKAGEFDLPMPGDPGFLLMTQQDRAEREKDVRKLWREVFDYSG